ncbi:hypothetical protein C8J57DRAFT_1507954 [Mycena rebaudengoi]|nr:hypothetical protein C8J57DRAFT_1507954 [Mycena rebaudengoi]
MTYYFTVARVSAPTPCCLPSSMCCPLRATGSVALLVIGPSAASNNNSLNGHPPHHNHRTTPIIPSPAGAPLCRASVAAAVAPLEESIDELIDPRNVYVELSEIAEGESGSIFACDLARVLVAIESVALILDYADERADEEGGAGQKLVDVRREDMVELVEEGLRLQEPRIIAQFASDMIQALVFLKKYHIAYRNLLRSGVLKLSHARVAALRRPVLAGAGGALPLVRRKVDVWSVGATVWELAEARRSFSDTEPPVSDPAPTLHCRAPSPRRAPGVLLETPFVQRASGRPVIVRLLSRCMAIEQAP